jgi:hypothetical protein
LLVEQFGLKLPAWQQARLDSGDLTDVVPAELRADAVVALTAGEKPVGAVVVEAQLGRDENKRYSWPAYLATLRVRLRCPTTLLVICPDPGIARWCAQPIELGHPDWDLKPLVLGPNRVPVVTDPAAARRFPELAVLSTMAHGGRPAPEREPVLRAFLSALERFDHEHVTLYAGVVMTALPAAARRHLEAMMTNATFEYRDYLSDFVNKFVNQGRREGEVTGEVKGEVDALLTVLAARSIEVPDEARDRITGCTDLDQLRTWLSRAATAESISDLFD